MKVMATGVTEENGMKMFELWLEYLKNAVEEGAEIDVRFTLENENDRT